MNFWYISHEISSFLLSVATGCGSSSSENCTYFEVSGAVDGACVGQICKCNDNICQVCLKILQNSKYSNLNKIESHKGCVALP